MTSITHVSGTSAGAWQNTSMTTQRDQYSYLINLFYLTTTACVVRGHNESPSFLTSTPPSPRANSIPAISELRALSGLTWDQLARIFDVSRRAVHAWNNGEKMAVKNQEKVERVIAAIKPFDNGNPSDNRRRLLTGISGKIPFDFLVEGNFDDFAKIMEFVPSTSSLNPKVDVSSGYIVPPEVLMSAKTERIHKASTKIRKTTVKNLKKRSRS